MSTKFAASYVDPSASGSLGGVAKFAKAHQIPLAQAQKELQQILSYTLHKPRRRRFKTLPTLVFNKDEQFFMDLVDMQKLAKYNRGYKYLLTVIAVLSKFAWVEPLKSKSATALVEALQRLWKRLGSRIPQKVQTDSGGEFYNKKVQSFLKKHGVNHFSTHGDPHGSVVERWNRTLKTNMYRYFTAHNTLRYIDVLPALVSTYNHTFHRSIQEKPVNVNESNEHDIWYRLYGTKEKDRKVKKPRCNVGDKVRLNKKFRPFKKAYLPGWTEEVFLVKQIYTKTPVVTYKLTEWDGTPIKGTFYEEDVQKVNVTDESVFRIDQVLKRKGKQVLVSWKGWPKKYNSWVWKQDLKKL